MGGWGGGGGWMGGGGVSGRGVGKFPGTFREISEIFPGNLGCDRELKNDIA